MLTNLLQEREREDVVCLSLSKCKFIYFFLFSILLEFLINFFLFYVAPIFLRCNFVPGIWTENAKKSKGVKNFNVERSKSFSERKKKLMSKFCCISSFYTWNLCIEIYNLTSYRDGNLYCFSYLLLLCLPNVTHCISIELSLQNVL